MPARIWLFAALAAALAVVFVGLGRWQLRRLDERRARNAMISARMQEPARPFAALPDTHSFRRATLDGDADYPNEIVFTGRSRNGSPGVYILTPVRPRDRDTAVIVIRGWVYAPDAASVDLSRWREPGRHEFTGYVGALAGQGAAAAASNRKIRALSLPAVRALVSYPLASRYLVSQDSAPDTVPARLAAPVLDDGPHLSYAIQWFSFALIALVGAAVVVARARLSPDTASQNGKLGEVDYR